MSVEPNPINLKPGVELSDGRYCIKGHLGSGGFAEVYRAWDAELEREVAIKVLNVFAVATGVDKQKIAIERFHREAKTAARLRHPNIVKIFDLGKTDDFGLPFMVMELLQGRELEEEIQGKGPMAPARAIPLFVKALEALGEAHESGIVHKDLKPSNLFLCDPETRKEELRILDFGIAAIVEGNSQRLTSTGQRFGTPSYFAPEYITNATVGPQLDVYQMGLILVEMLSGAPVVPAENIHFCLMKHCNGNLDLPQQLVDSPLGPILKRSLALEPEQRYANAMELAEALEVIDPAEVPILVKGEGAASPDTGELGWAATEGFEVDGPDDPLSASTDEPARVDAAGDPWKREQRAGTAVVLEPEGSGRTPVGLIIALVAVVVLILGGVVAYVAIGGGDTVVVQAAASEEGAGVAAEELEVDVGDEDEVVLEHEPEEADAGEEAARPAEPPPVEPVPVEVERVKVALTSAPAAKVYDADKILLGQTPLQVDFASADAPARRLRLVARGFQSTWVEVSPREPSQAVTLKKNAARRRPGKEDKGMQVFIE